MADPIKHDGMSPLATVGAETGKWSLIGGLAAIAVPVALGIATYFGFTSAASSFASGEIMAGVFASGMTLLGGVATYMATGYATVAMIGGGLLGAVKGSSKVSNENAAHRAHAHHHGRSHKHKLAQVHGEGEVAGLQQGYMVGFQEGRQKGQAEVVEHIQQMAMMEHQAQQAHQAPVAGAAAHTAPATMMVASPEGKFVARCEARCESKVETLTKQREAQAMVEPGRV